MVRAPVGRGGGSSRLRAPHQMGRLPPGGRRGARRAFLVWGRRRRNGSRSPNATSQGSAAGVEPKSCSTVRREVAAAPAPRNRAELLKLYARSVLAAADYPVALAVWLGDGRFGPVGALSLARSPAIRTILAAVDAAALDPGY